MANALGSYQPIFYAQEALIHLRKALGMAGAVHRGYEAEWRGFRRGETINIRKPSTFTAQAAPSSSQDLATETVTITLDQWREVKWELTDKERTLSDDRIIAEHIGPAAYALGDDMDQKLAALYLDIPWLADYAATTDHQIITTMRKVMRDNNVQLEDGRIWMMVDSTLEEGFLNSTTFHSAQVAGADNQNALVRGMLSSRFGTNVFANQNTPAHTPGTGPGGGDVAGAVNVSGGVLIGATSVVVDAFTGSETFLIGDTFVIAGNTQRYALTANTTMSTGAGTLSFAPAAVQAYADDAVITAGAQTATAHNQQLMFHQNAFALAIAPLVDDLPGADAFTAVDPVSGIAVRARRFYDGANSKLYMALDVLYGVKTLDPNLAVRGWT